MLKSFAALALAAGIALPAVSAAQPAPPPPAPRIVVTGEGEAAVAPDLAVVSLSVMREATTARAALDANNESMRALIATLKELGIADRDLQTAGLQISPRYTYTNKPDGTQEANLVGYQVVNTLTVRVREIGKTGEVLDRAVSAGVNQGGGISFSNDDPAPVLTDARKRAVVDAMDKARVLAEAAGVGLGRVLEISDQSIAPAPIPIEAKAFDAGSVPVQPGENAYRVQVTVIMELLAK